MAMGSLLRISCIALLFGGIAAAQIQVPEGTRLRVRLEEDISSATAQEGQTVQLSVVEEVKVEGTAVIAQGAPVMGRVIEAVPKRLTSSGKLDISFVAAMAADGQSIPLRYTQDRKAGGSNISNGLIGAGATILFGPTVSMLRMMRAKDIVLPKGTVVEVFTDQNHAFAPTAAGASASAPTTTSTPSGKKEEAADSASAPLVIISITSTPDGAKITVDGTDMGAAPASFSIDPGKHSIQVEKEEFAVWKRTIDAQAGTPIDLDVKLEKPPASPSPAKPARKPAPARPSGSTPKASSAH